MTYGGAHTFRSRALDMENFKTEVNILPGAKVQFELHYQEVKWRNLGSYEHRLHLQPGRLAKHLEVSMDLRGAQWCHAYSSSTQWRLSGGQRSLWCLMPLNSARQCGALERL